MAEVLPQLDEADVEGEQHHYYGSTAEQEAEQDFLEMQAKSREVTLADCRSHSLIKRVLISLLRIFSPLI